MRLLNTETLQFHEYSGPVIPPYAILSHRWEAEEVTYHDALYRQNHTKIGWSKVKHCCAFAANRGFSLVWIDTCCIDKTSSAELTEAINSMFQWYRNAYECYAYLCDVAPFHETSAHRESEFKQSEWFTRGWTLQELLAPSSLFFVANDWTTILGNVSSLGPQISQATGISIPHLQKRKDCFRTSIADRMSWMSKRKCTRIEDEAYCLLGLFNVQMPTLYGEGGKAFLRLQLEILKMSNDESIFAWTVPNGLSRSDGVGLGLLATSPAFFRDTEMTEYYAYDGERPPYSMTNRGLQFEPIVWLARTPLHAFDSTRLPQLVVPLNCTHQERQVFLVLQTSEDSNLAKTYVRVGADIPFKRIAQYFERLAFPEARRDMRRDLVYVLQHDYHQIPTLQVDFM